MPHSMGNDSSSRTPSLDSGVVSGSLFRTIGFLVAVVALATAGYLWHEARARTLRVQELVEEAQALIQEVGDLSSLISERSVVDPSTGLERSDSPEEYSRRERAITAHFDAIWALEMALQIEPDREDIRRQRRLAGRAIGLLALGGRGYFLASQAFRQLENHGLPMAEVKRLIDQVESARFAPLVWRRQRLQYILDDLTRGLARKDRSGGGPLLQDYIIEAVAYRDLQTVLILGEDLEKLTEKARRARKEGQTPTWSQPERDRAMFLCRVLGRLGFPECVKPLGEWMRVVEDRALAVEAGIALCNTRKPEAHRHLMFARDRQGIHSDSWRQIKRFFNRLPEAESRETPPTASELFRRGLLYAGKKNYDRAIEDYDRVIQLDPRHAAAYLGRGRARRARGDRIGALEDYNRAIELNPSNAQAYFYRGNVRHMDSAIEDYDRAIELDPKYAMAYHHRGKERYAKGDLLGAIADYDRALELDPRDASVYLDRGWARGAKQDVRGAIEDYNRAIQLDPRHAAAYLGRGMARTAQGDPQGGIEDYDRALELDPRLFDVYTHRGNARYAMGDHRGALADFERALEAARGRRNRETIEGLIEKARKQLGDR